MTAVPVEHCHKLHTAPPQRLVEVRLFLVSVGTSSDERQSSSPHPATQQSQQWRGIAEPRKLGKAVRQLPTTKRTAGPYQTCLGHKGNRASEFFLPPYLTNARGGEATMLANFLVASYSSTV
jgi:hypothetical protein